MNSKKVDAALISVVVPVHNVERYLAQCLGSLAIQNDPAHEIIIVDDGSTDRSAAIAAEFCAVHSKFRLVRQENAGIGGARNTGIAEAKGEFLTLVDSDDFVSRDYLNVLRAEQALAGC